MPIQLNSKPLADFDDPLGVMEDCHRRIENFLAQLIKITDLIGDGELTGEAELALAGALRYFRNAAPKHVLDEEETLFPRLKKSDDPRVAETFSHIDRLEKDHARTDELHASVDALGKKWMLDKKLSATDVEAIREQLAELHSIYQDHIKVEETHVFPLARDVIDNDTQLIMGQEMKARRRSVVDAAKTLGTLVTEVPARARILDEVGLDYCCGGAVSLGEACAEAGLDTQDVIKRLTAVGPISGDDKDWSNESTEDLVNHIIEVHHDKLRKELPHALFLAATVARVHGARKEGVVESHLEFAKLAKELEEHTDEEEQDVFPRLLNLPESVDEQKKLIDELDRMVDDHEGVAARWARLHEILDDFIVPDGACTKHRTMLALFERMEHDLHVHVHLENHVLFPRIREQLLASVG